MIGEDGNEDYVNSVPGFFPATGTVKSEGHNSPRKEFGNVTPNCYPRHSWPDTGNYVAGFWNFDFESFRSLA